MFEGRPIIINKTEMFLKIRPEYAPTHNEATLKLTLKPANPSSNPFELKLNPWNGLLRAVKEPNDDLAEELGIWTLTGRLEPLNGSTGRRINPDAIEDILVVCHYSI
jgi:hypothetical protein